MAFLVGSFVGTSWGASGGRRANSRRDTGTTFETLKNPEGKEFINTKIE